MNFEHSLYGSKKTTNKETKQNKNNKQTKERHNFIQNWPLSSFGFQLSDEKH